MAKMTFGIVTTAAFAAALTIGTLSWSEPAGAQDDHERMEREHRIDRCVDGKRHEIEKMEDRHEISREEADRKRDHLHEECERELDGRR